MNYHYINHNGKEYTVKVDNGMSWRDCPFFKILGFTDFLIGDIESAKAWLIRNKS